MTWLNNDDYLCSSACCRYKFVCHHNGHGKVPKSENKKGMSKNLDCPAFIIVKVKLNTSHVKKKDEFAKVGLFAIIRISDTHNHSLRTSETLRFLPSDEYRDTFMEYFNDGMSITESRNYHEDVLKMEENFNIEMLSNSRLNPSYRTVQHWYNVWWSANASSQGVTVNNLNASLSL